MKLYISDLHFFHKNLLKGLDMRPFDSIEEMNEHIISQWNSKVQGGDLVIILGDLFWTNDVDAINKILNRLKGQIALVKGNHDKSWIKKEGVNLDRFLWIKDYAEFEDQKRNVVACHYPIFCYNHQYLVNEDGKPRTFMLYGHVHNSHDEVLINQFQNITRQTILHGSSKDRAIPCNMINCFCMFSDYKPLSLDEWIEVDRKRREQITKNEETDKQIIPDEL